jgi:hypothetical protein
MDPEIQELEAVEDEPIEEMESDDSGEGESLEQEPVEAGDGETDELVVSFGEEPEAEPEGESLPAKLRKLHREEQKKRRELERELEALKGGQQAPSIGKEPELEDFEYDADAFKAAYAKWVSDKASHDAAQRQAKEKEEATQREYQERLKLYAQESQELKAPDFKDAEAEVLSSLDANQQTFIVRNAKNRAAMVYALGKNPELLAELSKIKDYDAFIWKVAQLETKMTISTTKQKIAQPEKTIQGGGRVANTSGKLDDLKSKARETGDWTPVFQYQAKMKKP